MPHTEAEFQFMNFEAHKPSLLRVSYSLKLKCHPEVYVSSSGSSANNATLRGSGNFGRWGS